MSTWTKPYCGLSYLKHPSGERYCSIDDRGTFVILKTWVKGYGFSPPSYHFSSIDRAKQQAQRWLDDPSFVPSSQS